MRSTSSSASHAPPRPPPPPRRRRRRRHRPPSAPASTRRCSRGVARVRWRVASRRRRRRRRGDVRPAGAAAASSCARRSRSACTLGFPNCRSLITAASPGAAPSIRATGCRRARGRTVGRVVGTASACSRRAAAGAGSLAAAAARRLAVPLPQFGHDHRLRRPRHRRREDASAAAECIAATPVERGCEAPDASSAPLRSAPPGAATPSSLPVGAAAARAAPSAASLLMLTRWRCTRSRPAASSPRPAASFCASAGARSCHDSSPSRRCAAARDLAAAAPHVPLSVNRALD